MLDTILNFPEIKQYICLLAEQPLASQEGPCAMEFFLKLQIIIMGMVSN
jgi:hypothetical protein